MLRWLKIWFSPEGIFKKNKAYFFSLFLKFKRKLMFPFHSVFVSFCLCTELATSYWSFHCLVLVQVIYFSFSQRVQEQNVFHTPKCYTKVLQSHKHHTRRIKYNFIRKKRTKTTWSYLHAPNQLITQLLFVFVFLLCFWVPSVGFLNLHTFTHMLCLAQPNGRGK